MTIDLDAVEWYDKSSRASTDTRDPEITVNRSGRVGINTPAMRLLGEKPEAFLVGFVRKNSCIVLRPATNDDEDSYRVAQQGRNFYINTKRFLDSVGFRAERLTRFPAHHDKDAGVLFFMLDEMIHDAPPPATPKRGRKKADA